MNTKRTLAAVALNAALIAGTAACSVDDDHDDRRHCSTSTRYVPMYFFSGVYYYDAGHRKRVPDYKLPKSAKRVPGFKPNPKTAKAPMNKTPKAPMNKTPKAPSGSTGSKPSMNKPAPAPRVRGRR
jgi:hypothetical protein